MFYRPEHGHGLPHDPLNALVVPRPIAWIATRGAAGDNLAPYSFFNAVAYTPPQVMFASTSAKADRAGTKDTVAQARESGVFCVHLVARTALAAMNVTSAPLAAGDSEFDAAGLPRVPCETIDCARLPDAPAALECRVTQIVTLPGLANFVVFGQVTGVHIRDDCLRDGLFDYAAAGIVSRLGYRDYASLGEIFALERPPGAG
jgi:flavin reductase (DIM6/NTAB) family NADH-FMN oxidoreductase RutF